MRTAFIDSETTSIHPEHRQIWDLAIIVRHMNPEAGGRPAFKDAEHQWFFDVDLSDADPFALDVGKYWQRHPDPYGKREKYLSLTGGRPSYSEALSHIAELLRDAVVVGAVPWFDMETLARDMRQFGLMPTWKYHLVDVETLAAGKMGIPPPWNYDMLLGKYGLEQGDDRHSALGDARLAKSLYDKVLAT